MRVSISLRLAQTDWAEASDYVTEAERLGVDDVWSAEAWGHDGVTPLAFMAARTSRIRLGTGILQAGTRTPALLAMTAMSLQAMSNGRFLLGLGVSGPQVIEGWHGIRFDRPVLRMRETVDIVRRAIRGERLEYKGKVYELPLPGGEGKALRSAAPPQPTLPIYLATLSPRSLEMTGEIADGWLGTSFMPEHAHVFTDSLAAGAARAGRSLAQLDLQAGGYVAFGDDVERLIPPRKPGLAFSLGAMGSRHSTTSTTTPIAGPATRTRPPRSSACGSTAGARTRRPVSPTSSCSRPTCWAPTPWCARACRPTSAPASPRCGSSPAARGSRPGSPRSAGCWTSFAPCDSMAVGRPPRSTTTPQEP